MAGVLPEGASRDAGVLLATTLAFTPDDARAYAEIVARITGHQPVVILSDDPKASDKIGEFAAGGPSASKIAVCVRMVSEGVDVPRAACLASSSGAATAGSTGTTCEPRWRARPCWYAKVRVPASGVGQAWKARSSGPGTAAPHIG